MSKNRQVPPVVNAIVEMGVTRMRVGVRSSALHSYLPRLCMWVDHASGAVLHLEMSEPQESYLPVVVDSLNGLIKKIGGLPQQIQLRDPKLATEMKDILGPVGVEVVVRESLPMLDEAMTSMMSFGAIAGKPEPGVFEVKGMTLDHMLAFADAGKTFYEARPWRYLIDDDLIEIESPAGPPGTQFTQVLGAGGRTFGLGFVPSRKAHEDLHENGTLPRGGIWNLLFDNIDQLAFDDGEAWERHNLPVAGPKAYPEFIRMSKSKGREYPTPAELVWAEGLLRALAATTEDELDKARWEKTVDTFDGKAVYKFSLPLLLDQMAGKTIDPPGNALQSGRIAMEAMMRGIAQQVENKGPMSDSERRQFIESLQDQPPAFTPTTDAERAQALTDQALRARGRRQVQLARQALAIDPACIDALALLADRAGDPELAVPLYQQAVEAGERQLGESRFKEDAGHFWGMTDTRPYMRARQMLAMTLMNLDRFGEAAGHFFEMLRLNPGDNQGVRYALLQALFLTNQLDRVEELLNRADYRDELSAQWAFARVLLEFRRHGDTPQARQLLAQAQAENPYVVPLLIGKENTPAREPDSYTQGSEDEAVLYFEEAIAAWTETPGAIEWLQENGNKAKKRAKQWKKEREKKGKKR